MIASLLFCVFGSLTAAQGNKSVASSDAKVGIGGNVKAAECLDTAQIPTVESRKVYGKETIDRLESQGTVKLHGTTITELLKITGALIARGAHLAQVEGAGDLQFFDTIVTNELHTIGVLKGEHSTFQQPIYFSGQKGVFTRCQIAGITIEREFGFKSAQVIELKNKTEVHGPIYFKGGGGKVHLYPGSRIYGTVSGGEIIYKR